MAGATGGGGGLAERKGAEGACDPGANVDGGATVGAACCDTGWTGAAGCAKGLAVEPPEYPPARAV